MKVATIVAALAYATTGFAAVAQPRACPQDQCPAKCKTSNMTFKESDCWGARAICICVDSAGKEWSTTI
ncbi:hypothetical protein BKA56DRAFT_676646 [Ilyonectria sp. MPI-CAGE-AT-0026]|nr:hypothetical protein BKA56DRAFT_676646 [Ilyonectria sp. MPI-CAGE-AT-0026]